MRRLLREVAPVGRDGARVSESNVDRHNSSEVGRRHVQAVHHREVVFALTLWDHEDLDAGIKVAHAHHHCVAGAVLPVFIWFGKVDLNLFKTLLKQLLLRFRVVGRRSAVAFNGFPKIIDVHVILPMLVDGGWPAATEQVGAQRAMSVHPFADKTGGARGDSARLFDGRDSPAICRCVTSVRMACEAC